MHDLDDALEQIREIRAGVASSRLYRGYRALPTAATGACAALTAVIQPMVVPAGTSGAGAYIALWGACALVSLIIAGASMVAHPSPNTREAISKLAWPLLAGALVTAVLFESAPAVLLGVLPGLWQIFFALALFASSRLLPKAMLWVASFYLASGALVLLAGPRAWAPACMGVPFFFGQLTAAWILQRHHG